MLLQIFIYRKRRFVFALHCVCSVFGLGYTDVADCPLLLFIFGIDINGFGNCFMVCGVEDVTLQIVFPSVSRVACGERFKI